MGFVKYKDDMIGRWVTTNKIIENMFGYFTIGSRVKMVSVTNRGYDVEDAEGNRVNKCGWAFFDPNSVSYKDACKHMTENGYCGKGVSSPGYCNMPCSHYER